MSLSFAVDKNNDLFLSPDGSLAQTRDLDAIMQAAQHAAQTMLGEMQYATEQGLPNFETVWNGSPNLAQFAAYLRRAVLAVDGVQQITDLNATASEGVLRYTVTIQTIYGTAVLNG